MPFSELFGFTEGKVDASHQRTSNLSADLSFQRDSDCCELVWDNGQIVVRNESSRDRKGSCSSKPEDGKEANKNSKGKFSSIESVMSDFPLSAPPSDMGLDEDDSTVPWLSCPVVEPFNNVYCPDTLPESFAVTGNEFTHSNSTANSLRLQQGSTSKIPSTARNSEASSDMKSHKINAGTQPNSNTASGLTNFSYFSRLGSLSGVNKGGTLHGHNNHMESVPPPKSDTIPPEQSAAICQEPDDKSSDKAFCSVPTKLVVVGEKTPEPVVAASSVCSGNSLERDSDDPANTLKRKFRETGDSEGPSEEVEEESVGVHQTPRNRAGSKRSRAAEVHNLSERRRRERINEKMRSLQELIPNCNKVDKASMLDEAIEYLKTLQLQVQLLSMGTGMYMSQMMLPAAAMQHMHRAHMSQFSPMGIGMGSPLGFGMSMPDMMQMSSIQPPCFPVSGPPISSSSGFYGGMSSSHLGQGLSISTPHAPLPPLGGIPMRLPMGNVSGIPVMADVLANNSMNQNQGPNQATMVLNDQSRASNVDESQHANALNHIKHS